MNRDLVSLDGHEHHNLEQIPGAVRPEYEPAFGIFAELLDCVRMRSGMGNVGTIDPVPERRRGNLHTPVS